MAEPIQWEYRLETFGSFFSAPKDEDLQTSLDEWGEEGWEMINIFKSSNGEKYTARQTPPVRYYPAAAILAWINLIYT